MENNKRSHKLPTYFTPSSNNSITIKYILFGESVDCSSSDILNYRTRKFAEELGVDWYSECGLDGDVAAIYIHHSDLDVVNKCASKIVSFLRKKSNLRFLSDED